MNAAICDHKDCERTDATPVYSTLLSRDGEVLDTYTYYLSPDHRMQLLQLKESRTPDLQSNIALQAAVEDPRERLVRSQPRSRTDEEEGGPMLRWNLRLIAVMTFLISAAALVGGTRPW